MSKEKGLESIIVLILVSLAVYIKFNITWFLYIAICLGVVALISKKLTVIIGEAWFSFSHYFGLVMNYIIMSFIFYLILTPLSFFQRLFGGNQILKKSSDSSYFYKRNHRFVEKDIDKPW
ncbi:SxtJ family membrane protein [Aestuariibaculum suncheonense]|uniref:SxtJ n=1 Tax=Aestuariibaculum suncheonense TaxID=1028745 RepID=A0A8J6Q872_9FLAO|nr:SxtJ family membrane protein [Aestuariibaculum suncheonense]MBD0835120.1 hypothetical protein [Aestuariibaculum suncheonense]